MKVQDLPSTAVSLSEIADNFKHQVLFHGTESPSDVLKILKEGFKREHLDEDGRFFRDGNLGIGIYLSCNWDTALWFGNILFKVTLQKGTRLFDSSVEPDSKILAYLKREFGSELMTSPDPRKVLPRNKKLTLRELAALTRYHYHQVWHKYPTNKNNWYSKIKHHSKALYVCSSMLSKYKFHGYGNPSDDNGIVIFQPERIIVEKPILEMPFEQHTKYLNGQGGKETIKLEDLIKKFPARSSWCDPRLNTHL